MAFFLNLTNQTLFFLAANIIIMMIARFFLKPGTEWFIGAFTLLIFELANPVIGIFSENWWSYTGLSFLYFIALGLLIILSGTLISKKSIHDFGENAMIYLIVMYYPFTVIICGIIRLIINWAKG